MARPKKPTAKRTMRAVKKHGYEGVLARYYNGKVTGYTSHVPDPARASGRRQLQTWATPDEALKERRRVLNDGGLLNADCTLNDYYEERYKPEHLAKLKPGSRRTVADSLKRFLAQFGTLRFDRLQNERHKLRMWAHSAPLGSAKAARAFLYNAKRDGLITTDNPLASLGLPESRGRADVDPIEESDLYGLADICIPVLGPDYGPVSERTSSSAPSRVCARRRCRLSLPSTWARTR